MLQLLRCNEDTTWILLDSGRIDGDQVEEAAFLLQIHEKRPPPRGPFPWAEGDLPAELRATTVESPHLSRLVG